MSYTTKYLNKYYFSVTNQLICNDEHGGLFITSPDKMETILHLNQDYEVVKEITIHGLFEKVRFDGNFGFPKHQSIYNISLIKEFLFISLQDNITCIVDQNGTIHNTLRVYKPVGSEKFESPNTTLRCSYKQLRNGRIITIARSKFHGTQIAISIDSLPDFISGEIIDSRILSNTYTFPEDYMCPLFNYKDKLSKPTIGEILKKISEDYWADQNPNKEHSKHLDDACVWDVTELDDEHIVLFLYTNLSSKSNQPNKNIPYYFCKLNIETGEVVKLLSPTDREIHYLNLFPKFIRNENRILFKTTDALYEIGSNLEINELLNFGNRSTFKKLFPVLSNPHQNHYIIPDEAELFSYSNSGKLETNIEELVKAYKKEKKNFNTEKCM